MFFGDGGNLIPEKPQILGMGLGIEPLKGSGIIWGRSKDNFRGFFGGKSPKIPKFWGGDGGKNIGDFPTTNGHVPITEKGLLLLELIWSLS